MRQYSIDRLEVAWFGLDLKPGLAAGQSIVPSRNTPSWSNTATGMGKVVSVYNPDRSGSMAVTVDQTSAVHKDLRALALLDRTARDVVGPLVVRDTSSGDVFYYSNARISTEPDEAFGTDTGTFVWTFLFEGVEVKAGNTATNVIGS